jgi:cyanamide hydratase
MPDFDPVKAYGLTALPADPSQPAPAKGEPVPIPAGDLPPIPTSALCQRIQRYVKRKLPAQTYNHSLRVYAYGRLISEQYFPQFGLQESGDLVETWFITAMLHDIGTTPDHIKSTRLSYEFWAGLHARDILLDPKSTLGDGEKVDDTAVATVDQMESIVEAIIRHQDVQEKGSISTLTRLIHLGTLMDNIGKGKEMVHPDTIAALNNEYAKREGWSNCFRDTVVLEKQLKPYAMVSRIEGFEETIDENGKTVMQEWDA